MKCDFCKRGAVVNYQKTWTKYNIVNEDYQKKDIDALDIEEPTGEDNLHLCKKHEEVFLNGET